MDGLGDGPGGVAKSSVKGGFRKLQGKTGEAPAHTSEWSRDGGEEEEEEKVCRTEKEGCDEDDDE